MRTAPDPTSPSALLAIIAAASRQNVPISRVEAQALVSAIGGTMPPRGGTSKCGGLQISDGYGCYCVSMSKNA